MRVRHRHRTDAVPLSAGNSESSRSIKVHLAKARLTVDHDQRTEVGALASGAAGVDASGLESTQVLRHPQQSVACQPPRLTGHQRPRSDVRIRRGHPDGGEGSGTEVRKLPDGGPAHQFTRDEVPTAWASDCPA